jgi:hypothetical protein
VSTATLAPPLRHRHRTRPWRWTDHPAIARMAHPRLFVAVAATETAIAVAVYQAVTR